MPSRRALPIAVGLLLVGCAALTSFDGFVGDGQQAIPDSSAAEVEIEAGCGRRWPPPPTAGKGGGGFVLEGTMSKFRFLADPAGPPIGFDLDNVCTCLKAPGQPDQPGSCRSKKEGLAGPCDVPAASGIDNAAGEILRLMLRKEDDLQGRVKNGQHGIAIRLQDYNGGLDDDSVLVEVYNVLGMNGATDGTQVAKLDGTDRVTVDLAGLANASGLKSFFASTTAYVANGVLVAQLRSYRLRLVVDSVNIADAGRQPVILNEEVAESRIVGTIERLGETGLRLRDAQLVGRMSADKLLSLVPRVGTCKDNALYPIVKDQLCAYRDIQLEPTPASNDKPCDALSFALGFEVEGAKIDGQTIAPDAGRICADESATTCD